MRSEGSPKVKSSKYVVRPAKVLPSQCDINHMRKMDFNLIYFARHSEYIDVGECAASSEGEKLIVSMGHPDAQRGIPED